VAYAFVSRWSWPRPVPRTALIGAATLAVVVVVATLVAPALGVGNGLHDIFPWIETTPNAPTLDTAGANRLLTADVWGGYDASLWLVPKSGSGSCAAIRFTSRSTGTPPTEAPAAFADGSLNCGIGGATSPPGQIQLFVDWYPASGSPWGSPASGGSAVLVYGHVPDGEGVTAAELRSATGSERLPLESGYFLTWLPGTVETGDLPPNVTADTIVASNAAGQEVAQVSLQRFLDLTGATSG
jgi:hypothetical protein